MATAAVQATSPAWKPQNDGRTATSPSINWRELLSFLSPAGQKLIVGSLQRARTEYGAQWMPAITSQFPEFSWLVELLCDHHDAEEIFELLQKQYPTLPLSMIKPQLENLHAAIRYEIQRSSY